MSQFTKVNFGQCGFAGQTTPDGLDQKDMGAKLDGNKVDASLLGMFGLALEAVAEVGTYGAKKYARGGWEHVGDGVNRYTAAMLRHYFKEHYESHDAEGLFHAAAVAWNSLARLELILREAKAKEKTDER